MILDRDGTLNRRPPRAQYVTRPDEFEWLPGSLEALRLLEKHGYAWSWSRTRPGSGGAR